MQTGLLAHAAALASMVPPPPAPPPAPAGEATPAPAVTPAPATSPTRPQPAPPPQAERPRSRALGRPNAGRLLHGVQVPAEGVYFFTWDPVKKVSPSPGWRRWATDRTVARTLRVLAGFRAANPQAPRVGIGDLSRPRGGDFGAEVSGGLGHASHQNGLDVDIYYPRTDGRERAAARPSQVHRRYAQDLVNRFVRAGAVHVFTGPSLGLRGPRGIVQPLVHHDDHLHIRFRP
jgi:murein endopeptidase